jgi:formylmethanofuran dehydrogenase subunit E
VKSLLCGIIEKEMSMKSNLPKVIIATASVLALLMPITGYTKEASPARTSALPPITVQDIMGPIEISVESVFQYHGAECPIVTTAFRATQLAIAELWPNEIPKRDDIKIISACPLPGATDCFEFITRARTTEGREEDFKIVLPGKGFSLENLSFTFTRKSTGEEIKIWVKKGIVPEAMFGISSKWMSEGITAITKEEWAQLMAAKEEFLSKILTLATDQLFKFEKAP